MLDIPDLSAVHDVPDVTVPDNGVLARHFVSLLLEKPAAPERPDNANFLGFDDDELDDEAPDRSTLSVDAAVAAVLTANALETSRPLLRSLRKESPIVIIEMPDAAFEEPLEEVIKICLIGRSTKVITVHQLDSLRTSQRRLDRRCAVILSCDADKRTMAKVAERAYTAMSLDVPICAFATNVGKMVPETLRAQAERTIQLKTFDAMSLAIIIEAVTGETISVPEESWIATTTVDDIRMSVSLHRGAPASLVKLRAVAERRKAMKPDIPLVQDLCGYGEAKEIALGMISDIEAYRAGQISWNEVDRGLVLAGPPGTGKTYFAGSFARSAGLPLFAGSLATWQAAGHLGDLLGALKKTFSEAKRRNLFHRHDSTVILYRYSIQIFTMPQKI